MRLIEQRTLRFIRFALIYKLTQYFPLELIKRRSATIRTAPANRILLLTTL